jgi:hypothetical protein
MSTRDPGNCKATTLEIYLCPVNPSRISSFNPKVLFLSINSADYARSPSCPCHLLAQAPCSHAVTLFKSQYDFLRNPRVHVLDALDNDRLRKDPRYRRLHLVMRLLPPQHSLLPPGPPIHTFRASLLGCVVASCLLRVCNHGWQATIVGHSGDIEANATRNLGYVLCINLGSDNCTRPRPSSPRFIDCPMSEAQRRVWMIPLSTSQLVHLMQLSTLFSMDTPR